jgi:hypothetical protein
MQCTVRQQVGNMSTCTANPGKSRRDVNLARKQTQTQSSRKVHYAKAYFSSPTSLESGWNDASVYNFASTFPTGLRLQVNLVELSSITFYRTQGYTQALGSCSRSRFNLPRAYLLSLRRFSVANIIAEG